jgi:hypothetical protein
MRVDPHRLRKIGGDVGDVLGAVVGRLVRPVPLELAAFTRAAAIGQLGLITELAGQIVLEAADIGAGDAGARRIIFGRLAGGIVVGADIAAVETADGGALVAQASVTYALPPRDGKHGAPAAE